MDDERLHIIITGEQGQGKAFAVQKRTAFRGIIAVIGISVFLAVGSIAGLIFFSRTLTLSSENKALNEQLAETMSVLDDLQADRSRLITGYEENIAKLEKDKEVLLEDSITRLDEKSKVIEEVMDRIGVEVKVEEDPDHSGGPFVSLDEEYGDRLILKADRYLEVLNKIPLGRPVPGKISSKFGSRIDPLNNKKAFHPGIDFRGHTGDTVKATADAVVKTATTNNVLGNYIILSHGNGYETIFGHLYKHLVKKGEKVKRGQVIGEIGNTGRSTGSHLHYGIRYQKKTIDPMKYLQIASLSFNVAKQ